MALLLLFGVTAMGQEAYKALKFQNATSLYSYEMMSVHTQSANRKEDFIKACESRKMMKAYIQRLRTNFTLLLGQWPKRGQLNATVTGRVSGPGFVVEKIVFQSTPNRYVTAHLYLPEHLRGKVPACIEMCGHGLNGKGKGSASAQLLARNGIATLVVDPISQGERQQLIDTNGKNLTRGVTTEHTLIAPALMLVGSSLAAQECFDNSRALDYLLTRNDIDGNNIGCYGFSGGGTQATYLLAADRRIKASCVGLFFSSRERTLETQGPSDGCQWIPKEGSNKIEIADMIMMNAPKPILILDGRFDFVDHWGALRGFDEVKQCYSILGVPEAAEQYYYDDGHAVPPDGLHRMVRFFKKHLEGTMDQVDEHSLDWHSDSLLCTIRGQVNLEYSDAKSVLQECEAMMNDLEISRQLFRSQNLSGQQACLMQLLGLNTFNDEWHSIETGYQSKRTFDEYRFQLNCEGEFPTPVIVRVPLDVSAHSQICIHLKDAGKASELQDIDRQDDVSDGTIHVFADLRGFGETRDPFDYNLSKYWNNQYRLACTSLHIGKPIIGQRVQDLHTLVNFCASNPKLKGRNIVIKADGMNALVVMHAALLDLRIDKAILTNTVKTWRNYIQFPMQRNMMPNVIPGVLRYYDIPDLLGILGERVEIAD